MPANPLKVRNPIFNECRIKDINISSRKSRVSPGKFITLTSFDVAVIAVAMMVVILAIELCMQKNRNGKIRTCIDQNNNDSHRVDNGPNCHENLSESNSPSEKNISNNQNKKDHNNENLNPHDQIREIPIDIQVSEDYINEENEEGEPLEESQKVANSFQNQVNVPLKNVNKQKSNRYKASGNDTKIHKQKLNPKPGNNNKSKSQHNLIEKSQSDKIIMDF